jgi:tRNA(Arg) A34 adenosine deaminase TadA
MNLNYYFNSGIMFKEDRNYMLEYAIEKAREINPDENYVRVYAVITDKRGRIVSEAHNSYTKTHPLQARFAKFVGNEEAVYLHAEIRAMVKCKDGQGHKMYVARVGRTGDPLPACPCEICQAAI